jgi:hypothetical protein
MPNRIKDLTNVDKGFSAEAFVVSPRGFCALVCGLVLWLLVEAEIQIDDRVLV